MTQKRTCLDCGFLTILGHELSLSERVMLSTKGQSAIMPANSEQTQCFKDCWVDYALNYSVADFNGVVQEIEHDRKRCAYFFLYEPGFTPAQHLEHQEERRKEKLQWKIARFGFFGALFGGIVGAIIVALSKWFFR